MHSQKLALSYSVPCDGWPCGNPRAGYFWGPLDRLSSGTLGATADTCGQHAFPWFSLRSDGRMHSDIEEVREKQIINGVAQQRKGSEKRCHRARSQPLQFLFLRLATTLLMAPGHPPSLRRSSAGHPQPQPVSLLFLLPDFQSNPVSQNIILQDPLPPLNLLRVLRDRTNPSTRNID